MLSPTTATTSSGAEPAADRPCGDGLEPRVLVRGRSVGPAQHRVVDEAVRREHRLGVRAFRLQAVGDDGNPSAERADPVQELGRARQRRCLATPDPGVPALGACSRRRGRPLGLVGGVADHRLVGIEHDGPAAGRPRRGLPFDMRGHLAVDLPQRGLELGGLLHPADRFGQQRCLGDRRCRGARRRRGAGGADGAGRVPTPAAGRAGEDASADHSGAIRRVIACRPDRRGTTIVWPAGCAGPRRCAAYGPWLTRVLVGAGVLAAVTVAVFQLPAFGGRPDGARLARMQASPQFVDGRFENTPPQSTETALLRTLRLYRQGFVRQPTFRFRSCRCRPSGCAPRPAPGCGRSGSGTPRCSSSSTACAS